MATGSRAAAAGSSEASSTGTSSGAAATAAADGERPRTAEQWLAAFAEGWRAPADADSFSDHFAPLVSDGLRLIQPQLPTVVGKRAFREDFARPLFALLSEVRGTVESSAVRPDQGGDAVLFVELTIRARLGGPAGRPVALRTIDRITIRDGVATERRAHLDPLELLGAVAVTPRAWPAFLRIQARRLLEGVRG